MDTKASRPPSLQDRIKNARLPKRITQGLLYGARAATFKGVAGRDPHNIFTSLMLYHCTPGEVTKLNRELAVRGIRPIIISHMLEAGSKKLPAGVLAKLWKERIYDTRGGWWYRSRETLAEHVGTRNVPRVLRYLKERDIDPTRFISWYGGSDFPIEGAERLWRLGIREIADLFTQKARELDLSLSRRLPEHTATMRDNFRTVRYARWWFTKKYPRLVKTLTTA